MKENAFFYFLIETDFLDNLYALFSHQPIKTCVRQHITNQNLCDATAMFTYSYLNTAIDQWECVYYPNYFIIYNVQ